MDVLVVNSYNKINERLKNEIWALQEAGYDVEVILWDRGAVDQNQRTDEERARLNIERIEFEAPARSWTFLLYLPVFYLHLLRELFILDYETVHCTHPGLLPACLLAAKTRGRHVVYDVFELHIDGFYRQLPQFLQWRIIERLFEGFENRLVAFSDGVVTIDTDDSYLLDRYRRFNRNSVTLYNVPRRDTKPDSGLVEALENEFDEISVVIHVGGLSRDKGVMKMVEAVEVLRNRGSDVRFLCIGSFRDDSRRDVEAYVQTHDLEDIVDLRPWMEFEEMLGYVAVADVGLAMYQPKFRYRVSRGNSRKIFTYMSVGVPVVASRSSGIREIVESVGCGISVDETDPTAIADGIEALLSDPSRRDQIGSAGRQAIEDRYNWEREREKLLAVYDCIGQGCADD